MNSSTEQDDNMSLAPGIGIIPPEHRNRGYEKLEFGPGEGGIGAVLAATSTEDAAAGDDLMATFLAGVAAGADPAEMATRMLAAPDSPRGRRPRR